jgi:hypothetical protein
MSARLNRLSIRLVKLQGNSLILSKAGPIVPVGVQSQAGKAAANDMTSETRPWTSPPRGFLRFLVVGDGGLCAHRVRVHEYKYYRAST